MATQTEQATKTEVATDTDDKELTLVTAEEVSKGLPMIVAEDIKGDDASPEILKQADDLVAKLIAIEPNDVESQKEHSGAVQALAAKTEKELARKSAMLKEPLRNLVKDADDGGNVATSLLSLQSEVTKINPNRVDFDMTGIRRLLSKLPFVGTPVANWFAKYQSVEQVIGDIINSLKDGKARLERDNITLNDDQMAMRSLLDDLQNYIKFGQVVDKKLVEKLESGKIDEKRKAFLEDEVLFPLRQRIVDLQQQLAVNQQGILTSETIIRNNKELIRGVNRSLNVTITALQTAATLAVALQHQKQVLKGVQAVTDTTNDLIVQTSEQLKTQGVEIQKQASSAALDVEKLKIAFNNVDSALKDISEFRRKALPQLENSIQEMDGLTEKMEESIKKMDEGTKIRKEFTIELEN